METLPDSKIETSKEDRALIEEFMGLPELYLPLYLRWNEIMPVVEKISEVCTPYSKAHYWWNNAPVSDIRIFRGTLEATYQAVVAFITWHNQHLANNPKGGI